MSDNTQFVTPAFVQYSFDFDKIKSIDDVIEMLMAIDFRVTVLKAKEEEFKQSNLARLMKAQDEAVNDSGAH